MNHDCEIIQSMQRLREIVEELHAEKRIGFDTETHGLRPEKGSCVVGWAFGKGMRAWYVPVRHEHSQAVGLMSSFEYGEYINLRPSDVADAIRSLLEDAAVEKDGMNLKHDVRHARRDGIELRGCRDVQALLRLTHPGLSFERGYSGGYKLKPLLGHILGWDVSAKDELQDWLKSHGLPTHAYYLAPIDLVAKYVWLDVCGPSALRDKAWPKVEHDDGKQYDRRTIGRRGFSFLWQMENELLVDLADLEDKGVPINENWLQELDEGFDATIAALEQRIYELAGCEFDVGSSDQVSGVLFVRLGLPVVSRGKPKPGWPEGQPSTDEKVLAKLDHPVAQAILAYRREVKLAGYVRGDKGFGPNVVEGRIHGFIRADGASTGRLSMAEPNLNNLPTKKTDSDNRIRRLIVSDGDDWVLTSIDLSQIEPRLFTHYAGDQQWVRGYLSGHDIYRIVGGQAFGCRPEEITDEQRSKAKTIVLGLMYGLGVRTLATRLGTSEDEARALSRRVKQGANGVFIDRCYKQLLQSAGKGTQGTIYTLLGRPRRLPKVAGHVGVNTVIQGGAADLFKLGMMRAHAFLRDGGYKSYICVPVHDELVNMIHKDELGVVFDLVDCMTQFPEYELRVPLECDVQFYADGAWGEGGEELKVDDLIRVEKESLFPDGIPVASESDPWYDVWQFVDAGRGVGEPSRPYVNALYNLRRELDMVGG